MKNFIKFIMSLSLLISWSCSKKSTNPSSVPSPGTGSNSLMVTAEVNGKDVGGGLFITEFLTSITDSLGLPVSNATVTITTPQGQVNLTPDTVVPGEYGASQNGYTPGLYSLNVTRGNDFISNAREIGPDIHNITSPSTTDTLSSTSSFTVLWVRQARSDTAEIETRDFGPQLTSDDGSFTVPASGAPRADQRIRVRRINLINLAGGRPGSSFSVSIRNSVEPIVVQ